MVSLKIKIFILQNEENIINHKQNVSRIETKWCQKENVAKYNFKFVLKLIILYCLRLQERQNMYESTKN